MSEATQSDDSDQRRQWSVEAEDGVRCYTDRETAETVAAGGSGYTLGTNRSPLVRSYVRPSPDDDWTPLVIRPEQDGS